MCGWFGYLHCVDINFERMVEWSFFSTTQLSSNYMFFVGKVLINPNIAMHSIRQHLHTTTHILQQKHSKDSKEKQILNNNWH